MILVLAAITNYARFLGVIPFYWCRKRNELAIKKSWILFTALRLAFPVTSVLYMHYRSQTLILADEIPFIKRVHVAYTSLGMTILLYNICIIYRNAETIQGLVNALVHITRKLYGKL